MAHSAWVEVDLDALADNARALRRAAGDGVRLGILVKANGYGHGLEMAARAALEGSADVLVVATLEEGLALRAAGITARVLVVYPVPLDSLADAAAAGLEVSVSGAASADATLAAWRARGSAAAALRLHVEVDSGMGRGGVPAELLGGVVAAVDTTAGVELVGVWSHLAGGRDPQLAAAQQARFAAALSALTASGRTVPERHLVASEGLLAATAPAHDLVRIGLAFYGELGIGFVPDPAMASVAEALRPALRLVARPVRIEALPAGARVGYGGEWEAQRTSTIATLPIGYADGLPRHAWPGSEALARGRRVPLIGRVSMDSVCVDLTDAPGVTLDDEIVLIGAQGDDRITVNEVAEHRGTIPNEVLATLGMRLPRVYRRGGSAEAVAIAERPERVAHESHRM